MGKILIIFEGKDRENDIFNLLEKQFFKNEKKKFEFVIYGTSIHKMYDVYKKVKEDDDLRIIKLLFEEKADFNTVFRPEEFSEIYLFFDYDGQDPRGSDQKNF
ncbi:hypothetical protein [Fusobacterium sp. PH5-44]|uniref:hypothetical protein n=1 Tax=unclassified Fusobacterium TaxID=2648384 RepID=UPI003D1BE26C